MRADLRSAPPLPRRALLLLLGVLALAGSPPAAPAQTAPDGEVVVLVHGLGRSRWSMFPLELALRREGFTVLNWGYGSTHAGVAELAADLARTADGMAASHPGRPVHFVGHSLGNILVRWMLAHQPPPVVGRVVMLAPPNRGARVADRYTPWLGWLLRPLPELGTGAGGIAHQLPPPEGVEVGIIAGRYDGKVSVEETILPGARDHVVVPAAHTFIMLRPDVQSLVIRFLRTGAFAEEPLPEPRTIP